MGIVILYMQILHIDYVQMLIMPDMKSQKENSHK